MRGLAALALAAALAAAGDDRLLDDDPAVRAAAAEEIGRRGAAAAPLVPQLIDAAYDEDPRVAKAAVAALARIGPAARPARPYLRDLLGSFVGHDRAIRRALVAIGGPDDDPAVIAWLRARKALPAGASTPKDLIETREWDRVRAELLAALREADPLLVAGAARALGFRGAGDGDVSVALAPLVSDPRAPVRMTAAFALRGAGGQGASVFLPMLEDKAVRRRRVAALCMRGPDALPHLRRALKDEDGIVRSNALSSIAEFHNSAEPALPDIVAILDGGDPALAPGAMLVLMRLRAAAAPAMPAIVRGLASKDPGVRSWACYTLAGMGPAAAPGTPALALACYDDDPGVVASAFSAIQGLGATAKDAAPLLAELAEADLFSAGRAREALRVIGAGTPLPPLPDPAELPALRAQLGDADGRVAGRAAFSIGRLAPRDAETLDALAAALGHEMPYARRHALFALLRTGDAGMPVVMRVAKEGEGAARRVAASGLVRFGVTPPEGFLPLVVELLRADDPHVRLHAASAAGTLGPAARDALPGLVELLGSADLQVLYAAVWAVGQLKASASGAVPFLVGLLDRTEEQTIEQFVFSALGEIGLGAEPAVPAILAAAREWGDIVPAVNALMKMGPAGHAGVVDLIRTETGFACEFAIQQIGAIAPRTPGLREALDEAVKRADERARNAAIVAMRQIGPEVKPTAEALIVALRNEDKDRFSQSYLPPQLVQVVPVEALLDLVQDEDVRVRWGAWRTLALKGAKEFSEADRKRALPLLLDVVLGKDHVQVRYAAADTLANVPLAGFDERLLRPLFEENDRHIRGRVAEALLALGPGSVPTLAKALSHEDAAVRMGAAFALTSLGPEARPAVPALRDAALAEPARASTYVAAIVATKDLDAIAGIFLDPKMPERQQCGNALVLAKADALPHLDRGLRHASPRVRMDTALLLQRLGDIGVPGILEAANDPDPEVAKAAIGCIGPMNVPPERAIPILARAAREADPGLRGAALASLQRQGLAALPVLKDLLASAEPAQRGAVLSALAGLGAPALDLLVAALGDADAKVRAAAVQGLRQMKDAAAPAAPSVAALLGDPDRKVREAAAATLGAMGAPALPAVVGATRDKSPVCRALAAEALRGHGAAAVPPLCEMLGDAEPAVRKAVAAALGSIGLPAVDALAASLSDPDPAVRALAAQAIGAVGSPAAAVAPKVLRLFEDPEPEVRAAAARAVGRLAAPEASAIPALRALLKDLDPVVRQAAAGALCAFREAAAPAAPDLVELFRKGDDAERTAAGSALHSIGATGTFLDLVKDTDPAVRRHAVSMFRSLLGTKAVEPLMAALADRDAKVRVEAVEGLGELRKASLAALPGLRKALADPEPLVRQAAISSIAGMGPAADSAVPELTELFRGGTVYERNNSGNALRSMGPKGMEALATFVADADDRLREEAQKHLGGSGTAGVVAIAPLMKTKDERRRREIATVLGKIGAPAVPALIEMLRDEDKGVRRHAAWALGTIGPDARAAVSALVEALGDEDAQVAPQAAWALGQIGPAARGALPALEKMYEAKRSRGIVTDAIRRIRGE